LLRLVYQLKVGNFTAKKELESFILQCPDDELRRQAIRLYMYVASNADIKFFDKVLMELDHDNIAAVVESAPDCCSLQIAPYLLALYEDLSDTFIGPRILHALDMICSFGYEDGMSDPDFAIGHCVDFVKSANKAKYYYRGELVFPGSWSRTLITSVMSARSSGTALELAVEPTLLSMYSGAKCPVYYGDPINDETVRETFKYVEMISQSAWIEGSKYFYGILIK